MKSSSIARALVMEHTPFVCSIEYRSMLVDPITNFFSRGKDIVEKMQLSLFKRYSSFRDQ